MNRMRSPCQIGLVSVSGCNTSVIGRSSACKTARGRRARAWQAG
jgi:hypothetical protein